MKHRAHVGTKKEKKGINFLYLPTPSLSHNPTQNQWTSQYKIGNWRGNVDI